MDHAGALLLWRTWGGRMAEPVQLRPEQEMFFAHLKMPDASQLPRQRRQFMGPALVLGGAILNFADHVAGMIALLGHVALDALRLLREPSRVPWREISANLYRTGAQALGITAIVGFLVGIVLSYLSAQQLRTFGADIYIVNLLGISIIRELGPVLAAILVAGRSGSAMTAQIGVMRVTEELDALAVMGIPHTVRLVLPKMIALAIAMPLLILWTNAIALMGGMASAQIQLGIDYRHFISALPEVGADREPVARARQGCRIRHVDCPDRVPFRPPNQAEHRKPRHRHHELGRDRDHHGHSRGCRLRDHVLPRRDLRLSEPIIEVRNLWTRFGRQVVHRDVSLVVYRGEVLSLVGGSGSGKTVLMRQMLGLETPARGHSVRVRPRAARRRPRRAAQVAQPLGRPLPGGRALLRAQCL